MHDRYQLKSLLGHKTGRRTFLAQDLVTQENVVVKLMLFNVDFIWDDLKLFEREVEVLKSLDLAAIPQYLDSFEADTELGKGFALVQTYIEARSLQDWVFPYVFNNSPDFDNAYGILHHEINNRSPANLTLFLNIWLAILVRYHRP